MLSYQNIKTIAHYEKKTLFRSWFFKIFAILAILGITLFHILTTTETGMSTWAFKAISGNIPYSNLKYLNIIQSIIAVFLASGFLKRDKKFDTSEVIYVRPMSNAEYIFGKTLGIFKVFMGLNLISLSIAFLISSIGADTPLNITNYLIYPIIISIPSIIFILGLSFILMVIIKNQPVTFLILLGYIGLCVFYFGSRYEGLLDYTSFHLPLLHSDIIGFGNILKIICHRGAYLLLGIGFIFLTVIKVNRLPHSPKKLPRYLFLALIFLISGFSLIFYVSKIQYNNDYKRQAYKILDDKFFNTPTIDIKDIAIQLTHRGENIKCEADIVAINNTGNFLNSFILSLNPGLKINKLLCNNKEAKIDRKEHIIIITPDRPLGIGEEHNIKISYTGNIDETVCYKDIEEEIYKEPFNYFNFNIEKRFAFIEKHFLLLTPESLWYPIAGIKYNSQKPVFGNYHFANYSLKVNTDKNLIAISQGKYFQDNNGEFIFNPETPLTQLSLIIGDFKQRRVMVDSMEIRLLHYRDHDYFSPIFEEINDTIPALIREFKNQYELDKTRNYPFKRITLIEVPAQFKTFPRLWTTHRETVQPEIILLPESGITLPNGDFASSFKRMKSWGGRNNDNIDEKSLKINLFNRSLNELFKSSDGYTSSLSRQIRRNTNIDINVDMSSGENIYSLDPYFYTFTNNIYSEEYPIINTLFESILKDESLSRRNAFRSFMGGLNTQEISNIYLKDRSFKEIIADKNMSSTTLPAIVENKANYLKAILTNRISNEDFKTFITEYLNTHKYTNTSFRSLLKDYSKKFNIDIDSDIDKWYNSKKPAGYIISKIIGTQIIDKDAKKYQLTFNIKNPEPESGIINVDIMTGDMRFGRRRSRSTSSSSNEINESYYIEGNSTYEIGIVCSNKPVMVTINTLTSQNIPSSLMSRFENYEESTKAPFHGIKKINILDNNEDIIVDNEDPGFSIEENIKEVKLKKLFKKTEKTAPEEKYKSVTPWRPPVRWTLTAKGDYYGKYIRSAYYIKGGEGNHKAIWKADIKKSGYYDVYFFKQAEQNFRFGFGRNNQRISSPKINYKVIVDSDDGEDNIDINISDNNEGWIFIGSYYFSQGEAKVILSNKSEATVIFADAVKWVKKQQ